MILLAIFVLSSPGGALLAFALYIGIAMLFTGFLILFRGIASRKNNSQWGWSAFEGLLDIFLGYVLLANPLVTAAVLPWLFGFWAVFYGILLVIRSFSEDGNKGMKIISGIFIALIGIIIMHNPIFIGLSLAIWVGIMILVAGIYNIIFSFSLK